VTGSLQTERLFSEIFSAYIQTANRTTGPVDPAPAGSVIDRSIGPSLEPATDELSDSPLKGASGRIQIPSSAWVPVAIIGVILVALYYRIGVKLVSDWYNIPDYSHGFLVPLFSIFLLWDRRREIAATPVRPNWAGLPVVVLGLITLVFGVYGVDLFTSRISFVILLTGLVWTFLGSKMLRQLRFAILILLLAIPFPAIIFNQITFPLQLLASRLASMTLPLLGVPVLQEGNVIQLPIMKLEVAEACSGIRSLMSLFTLAIFYGYFLERTTTRRVILALASIPIAVAANAVRIVGTGLCVQYWDPVKALGFFHEFSGWVMFVISLACLYLVHRLMRLVSSPKEVTL
jgi:exosortase